MKIAVVGAGYAGLAVTWHLLQTDKNDSITVFDGGVGASHVSTGLLHPSPGQKAKPTWQAEEGMKTAIELLKVAGEDTHLKNGILRIAATKEQKQEFGGDQLFIPEGITVFSKKYLAGLKRACVGAQFVHQWVQKEELNHFDCVILTTGAETLYWADLPLKRTIGQCLICECNEPIMISILSQGHITPTDTPGICLVGSTYEHTQNPDPQKAMQLLDQVVSFYPAVKNFKVLEILSGIRISPKVGYRPIVKKIESKTWVFAGLGSRGLIYHSLFARELVARIHSGISNSC